MDKYKSLKTGIIKDAEAKFGFPFDSRSRIKMCPCLSGPCIMGFEESVLVWFEKRTKAISLCSTGGHKFKTIKKCQRCGATKE